MTRLLLAVGPEVTCTAPHTTNTSFAFKSSTIEYQSIKQTPRKPSVKTSCRHFSPFLSLTQSHSQFQKPTYTPPRSPLLSSNKALNAATQQNYHLPAHTNNSSIHNKIFTFISGTTMPGNGSVDKESPANGGFWNIKQKTYVANYKSSR